jgi:hypothetical protein
MIVDKVCGTSFLPRYLPNSLTVRPLLISV